MITKNELDEFNSSILTGITVGIGSLILLFSSGVTVLVQCPFQCGKKGQFSAGHGEDIMTSTLLFSFLNHVVTSATMLNGSVLRLVLSDDCEIDIFPEDNGFESYVINTSQGAYPVITY